MFDNGISKIPNLKHLSISRITKSGRKLSGPLPSMNNIPLLNSLELSGNHLSGKVPEDFLAASLNIHTVDLSWNSLTGSIPSSLSGTPGINISTVGNAIPATSETTSKHVTERAILVELYNTCEGDGWRRNDFWNTTIDYCSWYGIGCANGSVTLLNLENNNLTCDFPSTIFNFSRLQVLWLSNNPFLTIKFRDIERATELLDLKLNRVNLSSLKGLDRAKSLTALDVSSNALKGSFPTEVMSLYNLRSLTLKNNTFSGELPDSLTSLPYLRFLDVSSNHFSGSLPSFKDSVTLTKIFAGKNDLRGSLPADFLHSVSSTSHVKLDVQYNTITGIIPTEFQRFDKMDIDLVGNKIESIPEVLCEKVNWNNGDVGNYGCHAIACPPGLTNHMGRQSIMAPVCTPCKDAKLYYGQDDCPGRKSAAADFQTTWIVTLVFVVIISTLVHY
jgi:Leucine-rich repeat (LRR) protein